MITPQGPNASQARLLPWPGLQTRCGAWAMVSFGALLAYFGRMKTRPYDYACGNSQHRSRQHKGRHVLRWPSKDKDRSAN